MITQVLFLAYVLTNSALSERVIKLSDFKEENSYLPVKRGQTFIIEIEGNPTRGRIWRLEEPEKLTISNLLRPINLDKENSTIFYSSKGDQSNFSNGFYHFHFQAADSMTGHEKIQFLYFDTNEPKSKPIKKSINIHVVDPLKRDL